MDSTAWIQLLAIGIPAIASIGAAVLAGRSARRARLAESQASRLLALEERTSQRRTEVYLPLIESLGDMMVPARQVQALAKAETTMSDFQNLVIVWGSDEVVQAFYRFRRAVVTSPPPMITMRLTGELLIAMRRDIAWPDTEVGPLEILGSRITDLRPGGELEDAFTLHFPDLARREGWTIPWQTARR